MLRVKHFAWIILSLFCFCFLYINRHLYTLPSSSAAPSTIEKKILDEDNNNQMGGKQASLSSSNSLLIAETIKKYIATNSVVVFSKTYCPYSMKAKNVLSKYKLKNYKIVELDQVEDGDLYQNVLQEMTGARTVPRVFINGKCIGGGDDTQMLENKGELKQLLTNANAIEL
ncbi:unnamed protein product [Didymodactylos carnosus]|uniref:Glutaredoxin-2, mitochondrial n=1 Tax=Didymodactylos carnosus TaxID=1234261 RepID=A0A814F2U0_9BILA|nr:unnamed protein product [Didymodactylos carnosus]CAF0974257.1 unnamed protein product [Didymodactylos carnosus]CAF3696060.1 unnamed protein product [Didymodactylos carnosus]CAF3747163.1 unnamed protein product [Didymodactylos carnosus]